MSFEESAAIVAKENKRLSGEGDPRLVIRGSECGQQPENPITKGPDGLDVICGFDWYQATILSHFEGMPSTDRALPESIQERFLETFGGRWEASHPRNGYKEAVRHSTGVELWWGGANGSPHLKASSAISQRVADWLRQHYPKHKVARADVAIDFIFADAFDILSGVIDPIARQVGARCRFVGDLHENDPSSKGKRGGRTWYYGSGKSDLAITLYEKGHEQAGKGIEADPNWVRLEVRIRPQKQRKAQAARLSPFDMIGFSKWVSRAVGAVLEEAPEPIPNPDKQGDKPLEHTLSHMAQQYGRRLREYVEEHGWASLDLFLYREIYTERERRKMEEGKVIAPPFRRFTKEPSPLSAAAVLERELMEGRR